LQKVTPPPDDLTPAARAWWETIIETYQIDDPAGLLLLEAAMRAFDRMQAAASDLARDGATIRDRWGQPRCHPAAAVERDSRAGLVAALKALDLEIVPASPRRLGRPLGPISELRKQQLGLR
jgi:P27 family predicted phage terminase small subunit